LKFESNKQKMKMKIEEAQKLRNEPEEENCHWHQRWFD
jgi:hypothetical protein